MTEKIDYKTECLLYLKLKAAGEKLTQAEYCARRSKELNNTVSFLYFKKVLRMVKGKKILQKDTQQKRDSKSDPASIPAERLKGHRHDWEALRLEFLSGPWRTLASFARDKGIEPSSTWFRAKSKTWLREKKQLAQKVDEATAETLIKKRARRRVRDVFERIGVLEWRLMDIADKLVDSEPTWKPIRSAPAALMGARFVRELHSVLKDMAPFLQYLGRLDDVRQVFDRFGSGDIDLQQAVIEFLKFGVEVPRAMQIMLSHGIGDDPPPDDEDIISTEKILDRRQEILKQIEVQRTEFVAVRAREIAELKAEMAGRDSFSKQKAIEDEGDEDKY